MRYRKLGEITDTGGELRELLVCIGCGAVVPAGRDKRAHDQWHADLESDDDTD